MKNFALNVLCSVLAIAWVVYDAGRNTYQLYQSNRTMSKLKDLGE